MGAKPHRLIALACAAALAVAAQSVFAGAQKYEPLSAAVQARLQRSVADEGATRVAFSSDAEAEAWLAKMSPRLAKRMADEGARREFLLTAHYEAVRAGLEPEMILGLIQVESNFRKYAVSSAGARGFMQVMPFWTQVIGSPDHNLFHLRTSLRYGCTILRHYLDIERGDLYRALARYNGSLGKNSGYSEKVLGAWRRHWAVDAPVSAPAPSAAAPTARAPAERDAMTAPQSPARAATVTPPTSRPHAAGPMKYMGAP